MLGRLTRFPVEIAVVGDARPEETAHRLPLQACGPGRVRVLGSGDGDVLELGPDGWRQVHRAKPRTGEASLRWLQAEWWSDGIGPGLILLLDPGGLLEMRLADVWPGAERLARLEEASDDDAIRDLLEEQIRRRRNRRVPAVDEDSGWLVQFEGSDPLRARIEESLLSLGNGVIGLRGSREERPDFESPSLLAAGVYSCTGPERGLLPAPWPLAVPLARPPGGSGQEERRALDLRTGALVREVTDSRGLILRSLRFVSSTERAVVCLRAESGHLAVPGPPALVEPVPSGTDYLAEPDRGAWAQTRGERGGIVAVANQQPGVDGHLGTLERIVAVVADPHRPPSLGRAEEAAARAARTGWEELLARHRRCWAQRWATVNVDIPSDPESELAVRYALFQLWNSVALGGEAAVGARGLSGTGYAGHVFWDADVFVLPAVMTMAPIAARAMLNFRARRLGAAQQNATRRGLAGARFPWESADEGYDVTPSFGHAGAEWVPILTGELEEHISADVAWAADRYASWTGDSRFLRRAGRDLVVEPARYWASRIWLDDEGRGHIRHVIGPDEYHVDVDDNAFTNLMARWNLRRAADLVGPGEETDRWRDLAARLVDGFDARSGRHEQFDGYSDLRAMTIEDIGTPPLAADLLLGSSISRTQLVKQPDVLMAHHMIGADLPAGSLAADLDRYLPVTAHGSSLSPAIVASLLFRAGRPDEALRYFDLAARLDLDDDRGTAADGLHLGAMGGVWQALVQGFAGCSVTGRVLRVDPCLPARWPRLQLRFLALGRAVTIDVTAEHARVTADRPIKVCSPISPPSRDTSVGLTRTPAGWVIDP